MDRGGRRRRRDRAVVRGGADQAPPQAPAAGLPADPGGERYDLFLSYVDADADAARRLARRLLTAHGLTVFFAEWSVGPGIVGLIAKGEAIEKAAHGALLFSRNSVGDAELMDAYAALLTRVYDGSGGVSSRCAWTARSCRRSPRSVSRSTCAAGTTRRWPSSRPPSLRRSDPGRPQDRRRINSRPAVRTRRLPCPRPVPRRPGAEARWCRVVEEPRGGGPKLTQESPAGMHHVMGRSHP
ncbi:TIR domain-containing protein [Nonomuraea thailandensis]